jgi:hypothetical protein
MKVIVSIFLFVVALFAPVRGWAQTISAADRDALVRQRTDRGGRAEEVDALIQLANDAAAKGLPTAALTNKIREGIAKNKDQKQIETVVRQLTTQLETADRVVREMDPGASAAPRETAVTLLAEALGSGLTVEEVRELRRVTQAARPATTSQELANAAKGLSFIKDARLPVADGTAVIGEAVRQGYRSHEVVDVGREVKRREADYRAGRTTLRALREAIARGDRPEQLFRPNRPDDSTRPAAARPDAVERPARPETPARPDVARPDRPATGRDVR